MCNLDDHVAQGYCEHHTGQRAVVAGPVMRRMGVKMVNDPFHVGFQNFSLVDGAAN
jgi:hypothetical protein